MCKPIGDESNLTRFVDAQNDIYDRALQEMKAGQKLSHWMWFIFPQVEGLGSSEQSKYYAIKGMDEARAYLADPILGMRLLACVDIVHSWMRDRDRTASDIFGTPDNMKLKSSLTLFEQAAEMGSDEQKLISAALDVCFSGLRDEKTLVIIQNMG